MKDMGIKAMLERKDRRRRAGVWLTKGENKGRAAQLRVACAECNATKTNFDEYVYVAISAGQKRTSCKAGHRITIGGAARAAAEKIGGGE